MTKYYVQIDAQGRAIGFFNDDVHGPRYRWVVDPAFNSSLQPEGDWPTIKVSDYSFDPRPQPDGDWPTIEVSNPGHDPVQPSGPDNMESLFQADPNFAPPMVAVRDEAFQPPLVEVDNPESNVPYDAFEISQTVWQAWLADTVEQVWDSNLNAGAGGLVPRVIPLEELRSQRISAVQTLREENMKPGSMSVDVGSGRLIPVDIREDRDFRNIQGLVTAAQVGGGPFQFRDANDLTHSLSDTEMMALGLSVQSHVSAVYAAAWIHKDALADLADKPSVEAYDITSGWPSP